MSEFLHYVLQGKYDGPHGWEDLTADDDYTVIMADLRTYREDDGYTTQFRVQREYKSGHRRTIITFE